MVDGSVDVDAKKTARSGAAFFSVKRTFDVSVSILLLVLVGLVALALFFLNPFFNKGPIFFVQTRMGRDCLPFKAFKFRTMTHCEQTTRSAEGPLEVHRITPLGRFLRKTRIDEFPQVMNVLRGEMSLIGPRPDSFDHAAHFLIKVPGYRERHVVRPGISGLAQTEIGYVEGAEATKRKVQADLRYIDNIGFAQEIWIVWRTFVTILKRAGA